LKLVKTYLLQQGKFYVYFFIFIAACIAFYFCFLKETGIGGVALILSWTVIVYLDYRMMSRHGLESE